MPDPILFGLLIMSTASEPHVPHRPCRSRSVGTRQSAHHQLRLTQVAPMTKFVYDMAPLWEQCARTSIGAKSLFIAEDFGTSVLKRVAFYLFVLKRLL
jgi:hypothetical protein